MGVSDVAKTVSLEWAQLDDFKKRQFSLPAHVQARLRKDNSMNDLGALMLAIKDNLK